MRYMIPVFMLLLFAFVFFRRGLHEEPPPKPAPPPAVASAVPLATKPAALPREPAQFRAAIETAEKAGDTDALRAYLDPQLPPLALDLALEALTELKAREALPEIAGLGRSEDSQVLAQVMKSLSSLAHDSPDPEDRVFAIRSLGGLYERFTEERPEQDPAAQSEADLHRSNAIEAIGRVPHAEAAQWLLQRLDELSGEPYMQYYVVSALGELKAPESLSALRALQKSLPAIAEPRTEDELTRDALAKAVSEATRKIADRAP